MTRVSVFYWVKSSQSDRKNELDDSKSQERGFGNRSNKSEVETNKDFHAGFPD